MIDGTEEFIGRRLKDEVIKEKKDYFIPNGYILTRPDFYNGNTHINMYIRIDENYTISSIDGDKCYSVYRGLYNRSGSVRPGKFTKRDIAYLRRYLKEITIPE